MGREIRRVPPDWEHPKYTAENARSSDRAVGDFIPLYDEDYDAAAEGWLKRLDRWRATKRKKDEPKYFWDWDGEPPDPESYRARKWTAKEATHYVLYETVSEGTPITPAFATKEELVEYLVQYGDFWDQRRGTGGWPREAAERMVRDNYAPSLIVQNPKPGGGVGIYEARDMTDDVFPETRRG